MYIFIPTIHAEKSHHWPHTGRKVIKVLKRCVLPRNPRHRAPRKETDQNLAQLIHYKNTKGETKWDKPVLDRYGGSAEQALKARNLSDKNGNQKGDEHSEGEPGIAASRANGVCLENRHALVADGQNVTPLHDHQRDEVDTLADVVEVG